jgi:sugar phosphate isomerase/epimerase
MKLGLLAGVFSGLSFDELLGRLRAEGLDAVELAGGAWPGTRHVDPVRAVEDSGYAEAVRSALGEHGLVLSALAAHGNPLHPQAERARTSDEGLRGAIRGARALGTETVTCFSGCPGTPAGGDVPNWVTCPWPRDFAELLKWQWEEVAIPYWRDLAAFADDHGVRIAIEMHPGMLVHHPEALLALREATGPAVGANVDPSHLVWQGVDPIVAVRELGRAGAIHHVHAKDVVVDAANVARTGVLDTKPYGQVRDRSWTFRTVGFGHDERFWRGFVSELRVAGYDHVLSIEHEDMLASRDEGVRLAIATLRRCMLTEPPAEAWWT